MIHKSSGVGWMMSIVAMTTILLPLLLLRFRIRRLRTGVWDCALYTHSSLFLVFHYNHYYPLFTSMDPVHYCPTYAPFFGFAGVFAAVCLLLLMPLFRMTWKLTCPISSRDLTRWHLAVRVFHVRFHCIDFILNAFIHSFGSCIRYFQGRYRYCWYRSFQTWARHEGIPPLQHIHIHQPLAYTYTLLW